MAQGEFKRFVDTLSQQQIQQFYNLMNNLNGSVFSKSTEKLTIEDFKNDYLQYIENTFSQKYKISLTTTFNHLNKYFGKSFPICDISIREAESFKAYLLKDSPKGVLVYLRNLKAAFNRAVEWEMIASNPFSNLRVKKHQKEKPAVIEYNELITICNNIAEPTIREIIYYSYYTGTRLNEAVNATWRNVDFDSRIITIGDDEFSTKSRKQRVIPMRTNLYEMLIRRFNDNDKSDKYVFHKNKICSFTGSYVSKRFKAAARKAGISEKIHFHSLRHTFGSELGMKGVPITIIRDLMGHSTVTVTEIYSHTNITSLKNAIHHLDELENKSSNKVA